MNAGAGNLDFVLADPDRTVSRSTGHTAKNQPEFH